MSTVGSIGLLGEHLGKQQLFEKQSPRALSVLREVARVQSIESSNRIEGVTAASGRVARIAGEKTTPRDRSEQEIAGYRDVLSTVHANALGMDVSTGRVLQLHRDLYPFSPTPGGSWKSTANDIVDVMPDGAQRLRFGPVAPHFVAAAMNELVNGYRSVVSGGQVDALIAVPAFVLDFLCIHPFSDGNAGCRGSRTSCCSTRRATRSGDISASRRSSKTPGRPTTRRWKRRRRARSPRPGALAAVLARHPERRVPGARATSRTDGGEPWREARDGDRLHPASPDDVSLRRRVASLPRGQSAHDRARAWRASGQP